MQASGRCGIGTTAPLFHPLQDVYDQLRRIKNALRRLLGKRVSREPALRARRRACACLLLHAQGAASDALPYPCPTRSTTRLRTSGTTRASWRRSMGSARCAECAPAQLLLKLLPPPAGQVAHLPPAG